MQPASSTTQPSNYGATTTSTTSTSSTNAHRPPSVRTGATNQRKVTVRRDQDSSEESTEKEKNVDTKSQPKAGKREAYKKAHKKGQAQHELPRFREKSECVTAAKLSAGASSASSTATTSDALRPTPDSSEAYRLQLEEWVKAALDIPMENRKVVMARIEVYLKSPEKNNWKLDFAQLCLTTVPPLPPDLKKLHLSGNPLSALPEHLPEGLEKLYVSGNELIALPEHLPDSLQKLNVSSNELIALPEHLPDSLQKLYVSDNKLIALPEHLPQGLQELYVINNKLIALPEHLPEGLQELYVNDNKLSALPEHLPGSLRVLDVNYNKLSALPEHLPGSLRVLDVSHNKLRALPEHLPEGLQKLSVGSNKLRALPEHLPVGLQTLYVNFNQLIALPEGLPEGLQELIVNDNKLIALPEHLPENLQTLYVNFNQLIALPEHLPEGLQKLWVSYNQLSALPDHFPEGLQDLDVNGNQLRSLPPSLLNVRDEVNLEDNPLPTTVLDCLQQRINAPDYRGPCIRFSMTAYEASPTLDSVRPLTDAIRNWLGQESAPWAGFTREAGATEFSLFLDKLDQSIIGRNPAFRTTFQAWLREMAAHPSLRAHLFAVAQGATASCQDRVMLTANDMAKARLLFQVERGDYDQRLPELLTIARGMFRLEKLEAIARKKAEALKFVDEVEVYLAYQVKLCAPLRLPLVVDEMAYFKVSGVNDNDLLAAEATIKELENREFKDFLLAWTPWLKAQKIGSGLSEEAARARQFALWDAEYEQPLAGLEGAIDAIDRQLNNGSGSTTSTTEQTHRLQVERQRLTAQKNALVSGARTLSDDIARRIALEGNVSLPVSSSLLGPVWDNDGGYVGDSTGATSTGFQATGT